jgi:hypothetical protein
MTGPASTIEGATDVPTGEPITVTINDFRSLSGLGRTTIHKMMNDGRLDYVKIGRRTLIVMESFRRLMSSQLTAHKPPQGPASTSPLSGQAATLIKHRKHFFEREERAMTAPDPYTQKGWTYLARIPDSVPPGVVLVHNHIRPARRLGTRGFRAWLQPPDAALVMCNCGWAPELAEHYRPARREPR